MTAVAGVLDLVAARLAAGSTPGARTDGATLAVAIEGGGMRGAITGGMVTALASLGLLPAVDAVYGASAGALNGAWLVGGRAERAWETWATPALREATVRRSNLLRGRPLVDGRYLTDVVYEHVAPMPYDAILASPIGFHPLATDLRTGLAVDLRPAVTDRAALKLALRASTCLPLLSGRPVGLGAGRYLDAGLAEGIPFRTPLAQGATHVLVLRSRRADESPAAESPRVDAAVARYLRRHSAELAASFLARGARWATDERDLARLAAADGDAPVVLSIRPAPGTPSISRLDRDPARILAGLRAGDEAVRGAWSARSGRDS